MSRAAEQSSEVSGLLRAWAAGDADARERLFVAIYSDLKACAARHLRRERQGHTLHTTALVHEAYFRLVAQKNTDWKGRSHFMAIAATSMRRVLVDHARARLADKRGGDYQPLSIDVDLLLPEQGSQEVLAVHEAIETLAALDPPQAKLVELRFFGGLSIEEAAEVLGQSPATLKREWDLARAWLYRRLK